MKKLKTRPKIKKRVKPRKKRKLVSRVKTVTKAKVRRRPRPEGLVLNTPRAIEDPSKLTPARIKLITDTVAKGATHDELQLFLLVCQRSGLDPFAKQVYFVKRYDNSSGESRGTIQTGIDGFRAIAEKTGEYAGSDDIVFVEPKEGEKLGYPDKATASVYRIVKSQKVKFTASARWSEYFPGEKLGFMWQKMPYAMLGKCAEGLALRKGFPQVLGGLYIHEEMAQANRTTISSQPGIGDSTIVEPPKSAASDEHFDKAVKFLRNIRDPQAIKDCISQIEASNFYPPEKKKELVKIARETIDATKNGN